LDIIGQTHDQWQQLVKKHTDAGSLKWYGIQAIAQFYVCHSAWFDIRNEFEAVLEQVDWHQYQWPSTNFSTHLVHQRNLARSAWN